MTVSKVKPKIFDYDSIINDIDPTGKYRLKQAVWISLALFILQTAGVDFIFVTLSTPHRCRVSVCFDNEFEPPWLNNISFSDDRCLISALANDSHLYHHDNSSLCPAEWFKNDELVPCSEYIFEKDGSFVEEMGIECNKWMQTFVGSVHFFGGLIAWPIIGITSDKFGRKRVFLLSCFIAVIFAIIKSFSINYVMYLVFELLHSSTSIGTSSCLIILAIEVVPTKYRLFILSAVLPICINIGRLLATTIAYIFPYWRSYLRIINSLFPLLIISMWTIEESNRWFLSKNYYRRFKEGLMKIVTQNDTQLSRTVDEDLKYNIEYLSSFKDEILVEHKEESAYLQMVKSKKIMLRCLFCCIFWIIGYFCISGLHLYSVELAGNVYLNYGLILIVDIPILLFGCLAMTYFGRRMILFVSFTCEAIFCISFIFIKRGTVWSLVIYLLASVFSGLSFIVINLFTYELFPTNVRHSIVALCSMFGKIGAILAPQVPLLEQYMENLSMILFACFCLASAILTLFLPETSDKKLPDNVKEAADIK